MKVSEITPFIRKLVAAYPYANVSDETFGIYCQFLSDIPIEHLEILVNQVIAESKFLPTVAEIRDRYLQMSTLQRPSAADAWGIVQRAIFRTGHSGIPKIQDEIVARVVRGMGWRELCLSDNVEWTRSQFIKLYDRAVNDESNGARALRSTRQLTDNLQERHAPKRLREVLRITGGTNE